MNNLLHVLEMGIEIRFPDNTGQRKLVHLTQLADVAQDCGVLQALGDLAGHADSRGGQVRFEQRGIRQQGFATGGPEVVKQWQQHHREIVLAAGQMLEVLGQLQDGLHQDFNGFVGIGNGFVEYGLGELFHLLGEQGCTVELDHLQGAMYLMEIIQAEAQARGVVTILDIRFQCMLTLGQRVLYLSPNPVEGDAVMVIAHNHSGYSSSVWRLIHASTCSEGTLCNPGGCQSVSSPWPSTSNPPGASRSASRLTISRRRQRRK